MESIAIVLVLLVAVLVSRAVGRMIPLPLPLPLVQIAFGAVIAWMLDIGIKLDPKVFFLLFLPPLLFLDGWRIPKDSLFHDAGTVVELAVGLVVFTVIGMGFFIHWLIPAMPLAVAFALAAVLSPTDPIAVAAIAKRVPVPKRLMHILEGESLLNDASGLVCLRFAIAAVLTGTFSLSEAVATFLWLALGGLAIGAAVAWCAGRLQQWVADRYGDDAGSSILTSLLIPFGAYLLAEHFDCSGILAAVAAGITMSYVEDPLRAPASTRMRRTVVWDMIQFAAKGTIFVLLGEQLPGIFSGAVETIQQTGSHDNPLWLAVYLTAITFALAAARFAWVWVSLRFTSFRASQPERRPSWKLVGATSLAGVKGAITLAGILTLPLALADGSPFPARDLAIFLAAGVIILSLVLATIGLPLVLRDLEFPETDPAEIEADRARSAAGTAAIKAIERALHEVAEDEADPELYEQAGTRILSRYRQRVARNQSNEDSPESIRQARAIEKRLAHIGLRAEREEVLRLARNGHLGDEAVRKLVREIDLSEARLEA
ncbi:Na+/H+ antiporter [Microvirga massiliensis]|uniref:Na+/H+ antiporter n=1 Tax=Microvirga massiliensis TaxID=1033741 RepID=UPI00062BB8E2|nr:Na+/H+ antiporter [Microvirga massiliensis]